MQSWKIWECRYQVIWSFPLPCSQGQCDTVVAAGISSQWEEHGHLQSPAPLGQILPQRAGTSGGHGQGMQQGKSYTMCLRATRRLKSCFFPLSPSILFLLHKWEWVFSWQILPNSLTQPVRHQGEFVASWRKGGFISKSISSQGTWFLFSFPSCHWIRLSLMHSLWTTQLTV